MFYVQSHNFVVEISNYIFVIMYVMKTSIIYSFFVGRDAQNNIIMLYDCTLPSAHKASSVMKYPSLA